jgi:hypothetical protein
MGLSIGHWSANVGWVMKRPFHNDKKDANTSITISSQSIGIDRNNSTNADRLEGNPDEGRTIFNYLESRILNQALGSAKSLCSALGNVVTGYS